MNTTSYLDPDTIQHIHPLPGANDDPPPAAALPKGSACQRCPLLHVPCLSCWFAVVGLAAGNTDPRTEPPSINVRAAWSTKAVGTLNKAGALGKNHTPVRQATRRSPRPSTASTPRRTCPTLPRPPSTSAPVLLPVSPLPSSPSPPIPCSPRSTR